MSSCLLTSVAVRANNYMHICHNALWDLTDLWKVYPKLQNNLYKLRDTLSH